MLMKTIALIVLIFSVSISALQTNKRTKRRKRNNNGPMPRYVGNKEDKKHQTIEWGSCVLNLMSASQTDNLDVCECEYEFNTHQTNAHDCRAYKDKEIQTIKIQSKIDGQLSISGLPKAPDVLCDQTCLQTPFHDGYALLEQMNEEFEQKRKKFEEEQEKNAIQKKRRFANFDDNRFIVYRKITDRVRHQAKRMFKNRRNKKHKAKTKKHINRDLDI